MTHTTMYVNMEFPHCELMLLNIKLDYLTHNKMLALTVENRIMTANIK